MPTLVMPTSGFKDGFSVPMEDTMSWLDEQYQRERREDDLRAARRDAEIEHLLENKKGKEKPKKVRNALGNKLVEWGERLQDGAPKRKTSTSNI